MRNLDEKVAIITGAAGGLGRAQALLLAKEGARVVATDIDEAKGKKVLEEVHGLGGEAIFIQHDVSSETEWRNVIDKTLGRFGKLDILVNNAGVMVWKNIEDTTLEDWRWLMSVNLDGVFWHPLSTDRDMQVSKSIFPLKTAVERIQQQLATITAGGQASLMEFT